jgi:N-acetylneuraminic acid mutarotase
MRKVNQLLGLVVVSLLTVLLVTGCGSGIKGAKAKKLVSIELSPNTPTLEVGATHPIAVVGIYSDGSEKVFTDDVTVTSADATIVNVSATEIEVLLEGEVEITSTLEYKGETFTNKQNIRVAFTPNAMTLTAAKTTIDPGETIQFSADATNIHSINRTLTSELDWTSSDEEVATVDDSGLVTGVLSDTSLFTDSAKITARFAGTGLTEESDLDVTFTPTTMVITSTPTIVRTGQTANMSVVAKNAFDVERAVTDLATWGSLTPAIATVSNAEGSKGQVNALKVGFAQIEATYDGASGVGGLTVGPSGLSVAPASLTMLPGSTNKLSAILTDDSGNVVFNSGRFGEGLVFWSVNGDGEGIVSVDEEGNVTALAEGDAVITALTDELSFEVPVTILTKGSVGVSDVNIVPTRLTVTKGQNSSFNVQVLNEINKKNNALCNGVSSLPSGQDFVESTFASNDDSMAVNANNIEGFAVLNINCGDFSSPPVMIEVVDSALFDVAAPNTTDFGRHPAIAVSNGDIHVSSYDRATQKLVYSKFSSGSWSSEQLQTNGIKTGRNSVILIDPLSGEPIICAQEDSQLKCWLRKSGNEWVEQLISVITTGAFESYDGRISAVVSAAGDLTILYRDNEATPLLEIATGINTANWPTAQFDKETIAHFSGRFNAIALAPDGSVRVAFKAGGVAYYGQKDNQGEWKFEVISSIYSDKSGSGNGIRLAVGNDNRPQVVFYRPDDMKLIHAYKTEGKWHLTAIDELDLSDRQRFGFGLDRHSKPVVSYQYFDDNGTANDLTDDVHAFRLARLSKIISGKWIIETPVHDQQIWRGEHSALAMDQYGRANIAYYMQDTNATPDVSDDIGSLGFYREPYGLAYHMQPLPENESNYDVTNVLKFNFLATAKFETGKIKLTWDQLPGVTNVDVYTSTVEGESIKGVGDLVGQGVVSGDSYDSSASSNGTTHYFTAYITQNGSEIISPEFSTTKNSLWSVGKSPQRQLIWFSAVSSNNKIYTLGGAYLVTDGNKIVSMFDPETDEWIDVSPMQVDRSGMTMGVTVDNYIYAIGGSSGGYLASLEVYDPMSDTWSNDVPGTTQQIAPMKNARAYGCSVVYNGKIYTIGGYSGSYLNVNEMYDPAPDVNAWIPRAPMSVARYLHSCVLHDNKIYVTGGYNSSGYVSSIEIYNPADNSWESGADMPVPRYGHASQSINNKIYLYGGVRSDNNHAAVDIYDPVTNSWSTGSNMLGSILPGGVGNAALNDKYYVMGGTRAAMNILDPEYEAWRVISSLNTARQDHAAAIIGDTVYVFGGTDGSSVVESMETLDASNVAAGWTALDDTIMFTPRSKFSTVVVDNSIFAIGGHDGAALLDIVEYYDTTAGTWTAGPSLPKAIAEHSSVLVGDMIYVFGGVDDVGVVGEVYALDVTNLNAGWKTMASMPTPRQWTTASYLDGKVYVVGGSTTLAESGQTAMLEIYDPISNTWCSTAVSDSIGEWCTRDPQSMLEPRVTHSAEIIDGMLYVVAGKQDGTGSIASVEAYDPETNTWISKRSVPTARHRARSVLHNNQIIYIGGLPTSAPTDIVEIYKFYQNY